MIIEQADELIKDICDQANDCFYNCHNCPYWKKLLKYDYPEEF